MKRTFIVGLLLVVLLAVGINSFRMATDSLRELREAPEVQEPT